VENTARNRTLQENKPSFETLVIESAKSGLTYTLGDAGMQVLLKRFELSEIAQHPKKFHALLVRVFQEQGASIIEREIVRELFELINERSVLVELLSSPEATKHTMESILITARIAFEYMPSKSLPGQEN
jgi:hypothetical protein